MEPLDCFINFFQYAFSLADFRMSFYIVIKLSEKLLSSAQAIHDWFNLICSLKKMLEQFTSGQIAIVNECSVK